MRISLLVFSSILMGLLAWKPSLKAQECSGFLGWPDRNTIVSGSKMIVNRRGIPVDGHARFAERAAHYIETTANGQSVAYGYRSWHLEIWAVDTIVTKTLVDPIKAARGEEVYRLEFIRERVSKPTYRGVLGVVDIPVNRIRMVLNGTEESTYFYSIDLEGVPFELLSHFQLDRLEIHHIRYLAE